MAIPKFLTKEGDSLIFNGEGELVFYIPEDYFRSDGNMKYAEFAGEYVNTLGLFNYELFDKNGKSELGLKMFYFPMVISCMPNQVDKVKDYVIDKKTPIPKDYRVLRFHKGDIVILNTKSPEDIINVENMFKIFLITGNIPNTIPYDQLHTFLMDSIKYNGSSFGISAQMFGMIISQVCRSAKDESIPFRLAKDPNMNHYKSISVKMVPKYISPFTSITSENWDDAVVNAIINDNQVDSPMEKILMG